MKILLAVDGSPGSKAAANWVANQAWPPSSDLRVVSVVKDQIPLAPESFGVGVDVSLELDRIATELAQKFVDVAAANISGTKLGQELKITTSIPRGSPRRVIIEEAEDWPADLIVLGAHGYNFWERILLGSVSHAVAQDAHCSVLIVRQPAAG